MSDRKAELERKKAKLQALREEKDRRRREKEQKDVEEATVSIFDLYCTILLLGFKPKMKGYNQKHAHINNCVI